MAWRIAAALVLASQSCLAQTVQTQALDVTGARRVLEAAEQRGQELHAPSSIAIVDPAGDLILFEQMQGARPVGIELAIGKAVSAARYQASTQSLEAILNGGRPAAATAGRVQMQGGVPIKTGSQIVGAVGVSGLDKENDLRIAEAAAGAIQ